MTSLLNELKLEQKVRTRTAHRALAKDCLASASALARRTSSLTPSTASVSLAASSHALTMAFGIGLSPVETKFGPFSDSPAGAKNA